MRSRVLAAVAFTGLLMTAIPLTASANDQATCWHEPAWGYQHPNWYRGWWRTHCGRSSGYNRNHFGNGGGRWPFAYSQYEGPRYCDGDERYDNDDSYDRDKGWRGGRRAEHQHWDRDHDGDRWHERHFRHDHFRNHHQHH